MIQTINPKNSIKINSIASIISTILLSIIILTIITSNSYARDVHPVKLDGGTTISKMELVALYGNSSNSLLSSNPTAAAGMTIAESSGYTAMWNNDCCVGLHQLNGSTREKYTGMTLEEYSQTSAAYQTEIWEKYISDFQNTSLAKQLQQLQAQKATIGDVAVDEYFMLACAQFGDNICRQAIANNCSSSVLNNGGDGYNSVCSLAKKAKNIMEGSSSDSENITNSASTSNIENDLSSSNSTTTQEQTNLSCPPCRILKNTMQLFSSIPDISAKVFTKYGKSILIIISMYMICYIGFVTFTGIDGANFNKKLFLLSAQIIISSGLITYPKFIPSTLILLTGAGMEISNGFSAAAIDQTATINGVTTDKETGFLKDIKAASVKTASCSIDSSSTDVSSNIKLEDPSDYNIEQILLGNVTEVADTSSANITEITDSIKSQINCTLYMSNSVADAVISRMNYLNQLSSGFGLLKKLDQMTISMQSFTIVISYAFYTIVVALILFGPILSIMIAMFIGPFAAIAIPKKTRGIIWLTIQMFLYLPVAAFVVNIINSIIIYSTVSDVSGMTLFGDSILDGTNNTGNLTLNWSDVMNIIAYPLIGIFMQLAGAGIALVILRSIVSANTVGNIGFNAGAAAGAMRSASGAVSSTVNTGASNVMGAAGTYGAVKREQAQLQRDLLRQQGGSKK